MAELLCVHDQLWVCCRGWLRFGCVILDVDLRCVQQILGSKVCVRDPRIIVQNPWMFRIRTLHVIYKCIYVY